jgi:hypothetical protein
MTSENKDYDQLITKIGGFGRFQFQAITSVFFIMLGSEFLMSNMNLLELVPKYECNIDGILSDCEPADFCGTEIQR